MKTAQEIILEIGELPPEERQAVFDYVDSQKDVDSHIDLEYQPTQYSSEIMTELDRAQEEARQGININGPFSGQEALDYLERLRQTQ